MSRRTDKIARSLQVNLAELINYHLNDPRIEGIVTISSVEVSTDLGHANVRVTALDSSDAHMRNVVRALQHASGRLRAMLSDRVEIRLVPRLDFHVDEQAINARRTLEIIAEVNRGREQQDGQTAAGGGGENGTENS